MPSAQSKTHVTTWSPSPQMEMPSPGRRCARSWSSVEGVYGCGALPLPLSSCVPHGSFMARDDSGHSFHEGGDVLGAGAGDRLAGPSVVAGPAPGGGEAAYGRPERTYRRPG